MTSPHRWLVWGCAGCALTTTGQPAAKADAVSPPGTEKANGKLLAPKTATGPTGTRTSRSSGWPAGGGPATSASTTPSPSPRSTRSANIRSWNVVRATSPVSRTAPRAVSRSARSTRRGRLGVQRVGDPAQERSAYGSAGPRPRFGRRGSLRPRTASSSSGEVSSMTGPNASPVRGSIDWEVTDRTVATHRSLKSRLLLSDHSIIVERWRRPCRVRDGCRPTSAGRRSSPPRPRSYASTAAPSPRARSRLRPRCPRARSSTSSPTRTPSSTRSSRSSCGPTTCSPSWRPSMPTPTSAPASSPSSRCCAAGSGRSSSS